jgi:type I pantothenate kinase
LNAAPAGFAVWDRDAWAGLGRGRAPAGAEPPLRSPVTSAEWDQVYVPLAHVVGVHLDGHRALSRHLRAAGLHGVGDGAFIIGLAGSVAAGKSTYANTLAALIAARPDRPVVDVLSTDGFLFSNAVLGQRGAVMRKGFPESYDDELLGNVLAALAAGAWPVAVPRYSHAVYDISGPPQVLDRSDVVIVEGINALARIGAVDLADACLLRLYLDADEPDLRHWYVSRFARLVSEAREDPSSFFAQWVGLGDDEVALLAASVWEQVNLRNLTEHILPTRWRADIVLHKGADHAVTRVAVRTR